MLFRSNLLNVIPPKHNNSLTLSVLCFIAVAMLVTRRKIETINSKLSQDKHNVLLREFPPDMKEKFISSSEVWVVGVTLSRYMRDWYPYFEQKLRGEGCKINVLLRDPDGETVHLVAKHSYEEISSDQIRSTIRTTLGRLHNLKSISPNCLSIKTLDHPISMGIFAFDPGKPNGVIYVEYNPYKGEEGSIPKLALSIKDENWYYSYQKLLYSVWNSGEDWGDAGSSS